MDFSCCTDKTSFPRPVRIIYVRMYLCACTHVFTTCYIHISIVDYDTETHYQKVMYVTVVNILCTCIHMICKSTNISLYVAATYVLFMRSNFITMHTHM